jgi:hypothetical protein
MPKYRVWVCLEEEYDDIEAENEEQAFIEASEYAMGGGTWTWRVEEVDHDKD